MKQTLRIIFGILLVILLPFLGGSMIWYLGGADDLDIDGTAQHNDRPDEATNIGDGWPNYGGDSGGHRYSSAMQITADNVGTLSAAWLYRTGDLESKPQAMQRAAAEGTPILVEDSLVFLHIV